MSAIEYNIEYTIIQNAFDAKIPLGPKSLKRILDYVVGSGAAKENEVRAAIGKFVNSRSRWLGQNIINPFVAEHSKGLDHTHIDALYADEEIRKGLGQANLDIEDPSLHDPLEAAQADEKITNPWTAIPSSFIQADVSTETPDDMTDWFPTNVQQPTQEEAIDAKKLSGAMEKAMSTLPFYWQHTDTSRMRIIPIMRAHFGFDGREKTFSEIGKEIGVTGSRAEQIAQKGLRLLRNPSRNKHIRPFVHSEIDSAYRLPVFWWSETIKVSTKMQRLDRLVDYNVLKKYKEVATNLTEIGIKVGYWSINFVNVNRKRRLSLLDFISTRKNASFEEKQAAGDGEKKYFGRIWYGRANGNVLDLWQIYNAILDVALREAKSSNPEPGQKIQDRFELKYSRRAIMRFIKALKTLKMSYYLMSAIDIDPYSGALITSRSVEEGDWCIDFRHAIPKSRS